MYLVCVVNAALSSNVIGSMPASLTKDVPNPLKCDREETNRKGEKRSDESEA